MTKVPTIHFDTADLPDAERFARWQASIPAYDVSLAADAEGFQAVVDAWFLGGIVVTANRLPALNFTRSATRAEADGNDHVNLLMLREGEWTGDLDGRLLTAGPGQLVLLDLSRPLATSAVATDTIILQMARAPLVAAAPGTDLHGFIFDGPVGRILADHLMLLVRRLPVMQQAEAAVMANATTGLIASCIASSEPLPDNVPDRDLEIRHRVFRHIDRHLGAPDLTAATMSRALGMSRSVIYRAFEALGGIAQYVRARRLEAAHVMLENPNDESRISEIAARFGFISDTHFSRAFRSRYGYNPRRARNGKANGLDALASVVGTHAGPDIYRAWVKQVG
jgi:AraC-like DNA-binding protein